MEPQKEIEELDTASHAMEKRLLALKNAYADNVDQKRDATHSHDPGMAHAPGQRKKIAMSPEDRYHMIAIEAYYRAKRQNFDPRYLVQHWMEAQAEVDRLLEGNEPPPIRPHHDATLQGHE